jgi:nucleoside-diphosphate-sugar epimerase
MLPSMRILVTGATGFVGGAAARRLLADGDEVVTYVRDEAAAGELANLGADVRPGSIGDPNAIADAANGCDAVLHCAAVSDVRAAPRALRWVNAAGTENVANATKHAGCPRLVYISCADISLTDEDHVSCTEGHELLGLPLGEHSRSKRLGEEIALSVASKERSVIALRPAWIWGPGDLSRLPRLCQEGLAGGIKLVGAGDNLIAITYIDNLVDAVCAALRAPDVLAGAYYVADNEFITFREFTVALSEALSLPAPRRGLGLLLARPLARARAGSGGLHPVEVVKRGRSLTFDISRVQRDLGVAPRIGLEEGMKALSEWAESVGGAEAIASRSRPIPDASSVDELVAAAGGD